MKISLIAVAVVAILALSPVPAQADASPAGDRPLTARAAVTVNDDLVRLGDLFVGAGDGAEVGADL